MAADTLTILSNTQPITNEQSSLYLLPLLEDYLTGYIHLLQNAVCYTTSTSNIAVPSMNISNSIDSSNDDFAIFIGGLNKDRLLTYSWNLYTLAYHSLTAIKMLVNSRRKICSMIVSQKVSEESIKISSKFNTAAYNGVFIKPRIFQQIIHLSNIAPQRGNPADPPIVCLCFEILRIISEQCEKTILDRFEPLLSQEILLNCFDVAFESHLQSYKGECYSEAVSLCTSLARSQCMLNLMCGIRDDCLLQMIFTSCTQQIVDLNDIQRLSTTYKVITFIASIITFQRSGAPNLLHAECQCSVDVIRMLVTGLLFVLEYYSRLTSEHVSFTHLSKINICDSILLQGIHLLLTFHSYDSQCFIQHSISDVQHDYIHLITLLYTYTTKRYPKDGYEVNAVQEMLDFTQQIRKANILST